MTVYINKEITLYDGEDGEEIHLREDGDGSQMICVKAATNYWGKIDFSMRIETARALAKAILEQCDFIEEARK